MCPFDIGSNFRQVNLPQDKTKNCESNENSDNETIKLRVYNLFV